MGTITKRRINRTVAPTELAMIIVVEPVSCALFDGSTNTERSATHKDKVYHKHTHTIITQDTYCCKQLVVSR